jgi:micrococcal nuclease
MGDINEKSLGCFGILIIISLIIAIVSWLFSNIVGVLGIGIAIWGGYLWKKNKTNNVKSKIPVSMLVLGILIACGWFLFGSSDVKTEKTSENVSSEKINTTKETDVQNPNGNQAAKKQAEKVEDASKEQDADTSMGLVAATVSRVVDGDTFQLSDGSKVRLVGVNTPESTNRHEQYGKEASNYTKTKLEGKKIWLQKDVSETDRYGRLL